MRIKIFGLLAVVLFVFASCSKTNLDVSDDSIIEAIENAENRVAVSATDLPAEISTQLTNDFTESYLESAELAPDLGYLLRIRRGLGIELGEQNELFFDTEGRELRRGDRPHRPRRGECGRDREPCFELVFPVTFVMPDGTSISGNSKEEIRAAIRAWYEANQIRERPTLQFPVDILYEDGTTDTLESEEDLRAAFENCRELADNDYDCQEIRANIGDPCFVADGEGTIDDNCNCVP